MYQPITHERWKEAQKSERAQHNFDFTRGFQHYKKTYQIYFEFLKLGFDLGGLSICEIGPADFPALAHCKNYSPSIIIEPMPSVLLMNQIDGNNITLIDKPLEDIKTMRVCSEVWLFNVMQHIKDPDVFINKCKDIAHLRIRFFEPINYPTSVYHPHSFSFDDYLRWFGDSVSLYKGGSVPGFHQADCAYGTYNI